MSQSELQPLPTPTALTKPYWDAAAEGRLLLQYCNDCVRPIMYPKPYCPFCLGEDLSFRQSAGLGSVYTFTIQERGAPSGFKQRVPYVLGIIALDEGVQLMSNIVGDDALQTQCGDRVSVDFQAVADTAVVLPVFRRLASQSTPAHRRRA